MLFCVLFPHFFPSFSFIYFVFLKIIFISTFLFCCSVFFPFFKNYFYRFVLFLCFILQLAHFFGFVFRFCVFVSFDSNCLISFLGSSVSLISCFFCFCFVLFLFLFGSDFVSFACACVSLFLLLIV